MSRYHVFGDTGGHGLQLFAALAEIGVDLESWSIPEDIFIVHLGDLIHKGPASNTIVSKVDELIRRNPGRWLQVLGNHEFQHIRGGIDFWRCNCSQRTEDTIQRWYDGELARPAWAFDGVQPQRWTQGNRPQGQEELIRSFLASHGGLTLPTWKSLGSPAMAVEAAELLNRDAMFQARSAGEAMGANRFGAVGTVWARAAQESFHYWELEHRLKGTAMPFGQLIGHSSPYDFQQRRWWADTPRSFRQVARVLPEERRTVAFVAESAMICMDPGYGRELNPVSDPRQPYLSFETR